MGIVPWVIDMKRIAKNVDILCRHIALRQQKCDFSRVFIDGCIQHDDSMSGTPTLDKEIASFDIAYICNRSAFLG